MKKYPKRIYLEDIFAESIERAIYKYLHQHLSLSGVSRALARKFTELVQNNYRRRVK